MAASEVEICNLAISWLAGNKITSLDDDSSTEAKLCRANYNMSRRAVLEEREWTFAVKRVVLTPLALTPEFGYNFAFSVPSESLRILQVYSQRHTTLRNPPSLHHVIEDNQIYADEETILCKFLADVKITTKFSSLFDQALAGHIAANIAVPLTESKEMQANMLILYEDKLLRATSSDSLQGSRELLERSILENSRRMFTREQ